jgi:flagella basal body P-ring formation protein FlgA
MTTTVERASNDAAGKMRRARKPEPPEAGAAVPSPPRSRRRWGVVVVMAALVCLGALGNVWLVQSSSSQQQVVSTRTTIVRGALISRADLATVQVGVDASLHPIPASQLDSLVGKRAALDIAAGSLLTSDQVADQVVPAAGLSLVGVAAPATLMPGTPLQAGDKVRVVATPGQQGEVPVGQQRFISATVVSSAEGTDTGQGAQTVITVQVPAGDASELAALAATGKVAIVLDSRER